MIDFVFLNSHWIHDRNRKRIVFLDFEGSGNMSVLVRFEICLSLSAQEQRWTTETVWILSFWCLMERIRISGWFKCVCCLVLKTFFILLPMVTFRLQRMRRRNREMHKEVRGRKIRKCCSISISVWMPMYLRKPLIQRQRRLLGIYWYGATIVIRQWRMWSFSLYVSSMRISKPILYLALHLKVQYLFGQPFQSPMKLSITPKPKSRLTNHIQNLLQIFCKYPLPS